MTAGQRSSRRSSLLRFPDLPDMSSELAQRVRLIPRGAVTTYGDLARALGDRHAATWVARWLKEASSGDEVPWHRVVRSTGEFTGGEQQARRLSAEGFAIQTGDSTISLERRMTTFDGKPPLERLGLWLGRAAKHAHETPLDGPPRFVAGLDVAYGSATEATVAAVKVDVLSGEVLFSRAARLPVEFPYIPGYLTFRELPALLQGLRLLEEAGPPVDVILIDGQGRLHPRRAGIATGFAAVTGRSTIGIGKSKLCGRLTGLPAPNAPCPVFDGDDLLAFAIAQRQPLKPVYVSVGGGITLEEAVMIATGLLRGRRLPVPIHEADRLSKRASREG